MMNNNLNPDVTPGDLTVRHRFKPINDIPRAEMLKKNSFPSVNDNRYLDLFLKGVRK